MKAMLRTIGFGLALHAAAPLLAHADGDTQYDMNQQAGTSLARQERKLKRMIKKIRVQYAGDKVFLKKFEAAQKAWETYMAAQLESKYPESEKQEHYGSVYPMCNASYREGLVRARITELTEWVEGIEEGDVCVGSVHVNTVE